MTILTIDNLIAYCVKTGNLDLSYVLEEGLLRTDMIIYPKKEKLGKNLEIFACPKSSFTEKCLSKRQPGWVLAKFLQQG